MSLLKPLPDVHITPINPVVYWGSYLRRESNLILKQVSHLDAFSGYLFPAWLPGVCRWRDNRCTGGSSNPVLSY